MHKAFRSNYHKLRPRNRKIIIVPRTFPTMAQSTASPAKKKSRPIKDDGHPLQPLSKNLVSISECGNAVASFLTFHERGRLLLVNHQLNSEQWGIVKEKTYGPKGMSVVKAAKLLFRVARSEFGPKRLTECDSYDAISALTDSDYDYHEDSVSSRVEGWKKLKKFWCSSTKCYDISSLANKFPPKWGEEDRKGMKVFFQKVNALLSKLKASCDYLEGLEANATALPDLYQYLIEEAGVEKTWLDRFAEIRHSTWGKAHFDDEDPPSYHTRNRSGHIEIHSVDQLFPGQDTIRALPSKSYKPKPIHLRECVKCHEVKADISYFECPYKWCEEEHKGKCGDCAPITKCVSCGKSGCKCCFVTCSSEGCTSKMCSCEDFDGWKDDDRGGAPGCSFVARRNDDSNDEESDGLGHDQAVYCSVHKPEGAVKNVGPGSECVIM